MNPIIVSDITGYLESIAPLDIQEPYDNSGLLTGNPRQAVTSVLISLDCTEVIIDEAIARGCNMIISHHPLIFKPLKQLTGADEVQRTVIKAIRHEIALYAIHTNLDNAGIQGVNGTFAERLSLSGCRVLAPMSGLLRKLVTFVPSAQTEQVRQAVCAAGAGQIGNYDQCSFYTTGTGTFRANPGSTPFVGNIGDIHTEPEQRIEFIFPQHLEAVVIKALRDSHPYEEPAFDLVPLGNSNPLLGAGLVGQLPEAMPSAQFLEYLRDRMKLTAIRHTAYDGLVRKVAICGGSGAFLIKSARKAGADAYITADIKYHEFFQAGESMLLADIGHFESEIFTCNLLKDLILKKFSTFAVLLSEINTNPINYS